MTDELQLLIHIIKMWPTYAGGLADRDPSHPEARWPFEPAQTHPVWVESKTLTVLATGDAVNALLDARHKVQELINAPDLQHERISQIRVLPVDEPTLLSARSATAIALHAAS